MPEGNTLSYLANSEELVKAYFPLKGGKVPAELREPKPGDNQPRGSYTVSPEEAARLRNMAMQNSGSDMSPEARKALDSLDTEDYDKRISKEVHNNICFDEAKQSKKKYSEEAVAFTNSVMPVEATRELLDENAAEDKLSKFDFGDIEEYLQQLEELSFLEAVSHKKRIDEETARWKSCKASIKAINELRLNDATNRELMRANAMGEYGFNEEFEAFETSYDTNLEKLNKISDKLTSIINASKDDMDSTTFLTKEMIHLMDVKISRLTPDTMNYEYLLKSMTTVRDAFSNRLNLDYMKTKSVNFVAIPKVIVKQLRQDAKLLNAGKHTKVLNDLYRKFSKENVYSAYCVLTSAVFDDFEAAGMAYMMLSLIAKVMNTEKNSSNDVWAKTLMLNFSDIHNNIFDMTEAPGYENTDENLADRYIDNVHTTFYVDFASIIDEYDIAIPDIMDMLERDMKK